MCWALDFWMRFAIIMAELLALYHNRIQIVVNLWTYIIMCLSIISIIITLFLAFISCSSPILFLARVFYVYFFSLVFHVPTVIFFWIHLSLHLGLSFHHWMLPFSDLISFTIHIKAMIHILDVKFPLFVNSNEKKIVLFACAAYHLRSSYMTQYYTMTLNTPNDDIQQRIICLCDLYRIVLSFR